MHAEIKNLMKSTSGIREEERDVVRQPAIRECIHHLLYEFFYEKLTEFSDIHSEGLDLCVGSPRLPSESAESNGCLGCPILHICFRWDDSCPRLHGLY